MAEDMVGNYTIQKTRGGSVLWRDGGPPYVSSVRRSVGCYMSSFLKHMVQLGSDALKWAGTLKENPLEQIKVEYGSNVARGIECLVRKVARNYSEGSDILRGVAQLPGKAISLAESLDPSIETPEFMFPIEVGLDSCVHPLAFYWKVVKKIRDCIKEGGSFYLEDGALVPVGKRVFSSDSIDERLLIGRIKYPEEKNELYPEEKNEFSLYAKILKAQR